MKNNTFFLMKLISIAEALFNYKDDSADLNKLIKCPADGKNRYVLCSPTVSRLLKPSDASFDTRLRIALPDTSNGIYDVNSYVFELYQQGELVSSTPLVSLDDAQASAIEAEIYNFLLKKQGMSISLL